MVDSSVPADALQSSGVGRILRPDPGLRRRFVGLGVAAGMTMLGLVCLIPNAAAAACPQPVRDRYEPGETVTIVGYTQDCLADDARSSATRDQPLYGYLHPDGNRPAVEPATGLLLGQFGLAETADASRGRRLSLTFTLPADLAAGAYYVEICRDPCTRRLTDEAPVHVSSWGWPSWPIYVGVDPPENRRIVRMWPLDDPAIGDLADDARLVDTEGNETTVAAIRTGRAGVAHQAEPPESAAPARIDDAASSNGSARAILWLVTVAVLLVGARAVSRRGQPRKKVRPSR